MAQGHKRVTVKAAVVRLIPTRGMNDYLLIFSFLEERSVLTLGLCLPYCEDKTEKNVLMCIMYAYVSRRAYVHWERSSVEPCPLLHYGALVV